MTQFLFLVRRNLTGRPVKSIAMIILAALLGGVLFAGTALTGAVQNGFTAMQRRLGADIMVVPYAAITRKNFDNEFLLGSAGAFYMSGDNADKISQMEGVSQVTSQFYLTDEEMDLCEDPVHLMAYDPETDFCVTPWITSSAENKSENPGAVIGSGIQARAGDEITCFDQPLTVIGKMDTTGTDFDTSIYVDMDTVRALADASGDETLKDRVSMNDSNVVSTILVDVADGYDIESVANDVNIHVKKVRALQSKGMVTDEASSMKGASLTIGILTGAVWAIAMAVICAVSLMMTGERKKEFAVLRVMGASRRKLSSIVFAEGIILSFTGSVIGIAIGMAALPAANGLMSSVLKMPLQMPAAGRSALCALLALLLSMTAGVTGSFLSARRVTSQDAGAALRES